MLLFIAVKAFEVFSAFLFKVFAFTLSFFESSAVLPIYDVGISLFLLLEIAVFFRVFLLFSTKVVI
jgi:hypothetical protein